MKKLFLLMLILMFLLVGFNIGYCENQSTNYPNKNVRIIVPFDPGGAVDVTCRIIAEILPKYLNCDKVIVENKPGGGAVIGQTYVAKAEPDGYTILAFTSSVVTNPMTKETTYTHESFQPLAMYCFAPDILIVPSNSKFKTLEDFIEYSKENEISINDAGVACAHHIAGLILQNRLSTKFSFIHTNGVAMQLQQLMGGHVEAGLLTIGEVDTQIEEGTIRALGVMHDERADTFPDVPTFREKGVDILYGAWRGLAVPKDTPNEIVKILADALEKTINDNQFVNIMKKAGYPVIFRGPEDFTKYVNQSAKDLAVIIPMLQEEAF